jgi:hypothetical protein
MNIPNSTYLTKYVLHELDLMESDLLIAKALKKNDYDLDYLNKLNYINGRIDAYIKMLKDLKIVED